MRIISKYQCDYCAKVFNESKSCESHEKRHLKIVNFLKKNVKNNRCDYEISIDDIIINGKLLFPKECIFKNSEYSSKETFTNYDKFISLYKNSPDIMEIEIPNISSNSRNIDIFSDISMSCFITNIQLGSFANGEYTRPRFSFKVNLSKYISKSDSTIILKNKLIGKELNSISIVNGYINIIYSGPKNENHFKFKVEKQCQ